MGQKFRNGVFLTAAACFLMVPSLAWAAPRSKKKPGPPPPAASAKPAENANINAAPDIDRAKAFLKLSELPLNVEKPVVKSDAAPLPDRAVEPISASRKLIAEQRYTEAALELERALRYAPGHPEINANLAMLHWQAGNLERAKSSATQTVDANPQSVIGHYILGRCLAAGGDRQGAMKELRIATLCADFGSDPEVAALVHFHLAEMLAADSYLTAAIEEYEAFGRVAAKANPAPRSELGSLLITRRGSMEQSKADMLEKLGRFDEAAVVLKPILERNAGDVELQVRYARLLLGANRPDQAASAIAAIDSDDEKMLDLLIDIRKKAGQVDKLIEDLRARAKAHPTSANIANRFARILVEQDRNEEACAVLSDFLSRNPDNASVRQTQLDLLVRTKRWNEAIRLSADKLRAEPAHEHEVEIILDAVRATPDAVGGILATSKDALADKFHLYLLGRVAADAQRLDEAGQLLRQVLALDTKFIPARAALAELLLRKCDFQAARDVAARLDSETPEDARLEAVLGRIYDRLDDTDKAELHYRAAIQLNRGDIPSMYALANVYRRTKRNLQAQRQLRTLLDLRQVHEPARELLALTLREENKRDAARQEYLEMQRLSQKATTKARCRIVLDESLATNPAERRRILLEAIEQSSPDAPAWAAVAETYEDTEPEKAAEYYGKALQLDPEDEDSMLGVLRAQQHQLHFDKVAAGLEEMLRCRPNRHIWRRMLVGMYSLLEQFDRGLKIAEEHEARTDLDPARKAEYRETLVETLRESGRRDEAVARLQGWAKDDPKGQWAQRLAVEYSRQRRYEEAVKTYESLLAQVPDNMAVRDRLLDALLDAKQFTRAEQYIVRWFAEDPQNDRLVLALAQVLSRAQRVDEAIDLINTWLLKTQRRELFQNAAFSILASAGRFDDCAQWIESLIDEAVAVARFGGDISRLGVDQLTDDRKIRLPNEPFAMEHIQDRVEMLRLAHISSLGNARRFNDAQQLLDELMQSNPDPAYRIDLLARQSTLYRLQGREDEAVAVLQSAMPLRASTESLSNDIAYSWIDRGVKLEEAEKMIVYALGRVPRQAAYLDTYGWLLYKKGDFEGARLWLTRANRVRGGDDPVIHDHLGDTYWRLKNRDAAIAQWKQAFDLVADRTQAELTNDDERRVARVTGHKVEDALAATEPNVAALASESPLKKEESEPRP